jgi:two-component system cell cycle sensor histidine kinase/response regulator CckA
MKDSTDLRDGYLPGQVKTSDVSLGSAHFRAMIETSPEMMALVSAEGTMFYASPSTELILGYPLDEFVERNAFDLIHPEDQQRTRALFLQLLATPGGAVSTAYRLRDNSGCWRWMEGTGRNLLSDPEVGAVVVCYRDIGDLKRGQEEREAIIEIIHAVNVTSGLDELLPLIHSALKKVVSADNCFVALLDPASGLFHFPFFVDRYDSAPAPQRMGRSCTAFVFRTGRPMLITQKVFDRLVEEGEVELVGTSSPTWLGVPLRTPRETIGVMVLQHYEDANAYSERDLEFLTSVGGQIAVAIERKQADDTLRKQQQEQEMIFHSAPGMIFYKDKENRILRANRAVAESIGMSVKEIEGKSTFDLYPEDAAQYYRDDLEVIETGQPKLGIVEPYRTPAGGMRWVRTDKIPYRDQDGNIIGIIVFALDITEQRALEQQFRQAQKMEAVGRLAGGVAHDFNNLLMVIKGHSELLLDAIPQEERLIRKVENIQKAADRAATLTRQLLAFSRMQVLEPKIVDLNTVISDMSKLLPRLVGEDIELQIVCGEKLGNIKADPSEIEQVLVNLAVNARDAMPNGGKLVIETANAELDDSYSRKHPSMVPGSYVLLSVSDTGIGMDAETQAHVFEPFFTTKEKGKGTGLGLATVYGVVKQSGGYIWLYSEPEQGTTFKIYLPRVEKPAEVARRKSSSKELPRGTETILLVEDELEVREVAAEFLRECGYTVLEARDGIDAVKVADQHAAPIHILLTDMVMPGMGGRDLASRLGSLRPGMKLIYMSGYTEYARHTNDESLPTGLHLAKPFTRSALAKKIREALTEDRET